MLFRGILSAFSFLIISYGAWLQFVEPTKKAVLVDDKYPGTLASETISSEKIFSVNEQSVSGTSKVIIDSGDTYLRLEDFRYRPKFPGCKNIQVILSVETDPKQGVFIGKLNATEGNINYRIPKDINYEDYSQVVIWCKTFNTVYARSELHKKEKRPLFLRG